MISVLSSVAVASALALGGREPRRLQSWNQFPPGKGTDFKLEIIAYDNCPQGGQTGTGGGNGVIKIKAITYTEQGWYIDRRAQNKIELVRSSDNNWAVLDGLSCERRDPAVVAFPKDLDVVGGPEFAVFARGKGKMGSKIDMTACYIEDVPSGCDATLPGGETNPCDGAADSTACLEFLDVCDQSAAPGSDSRADCEAAYACVGVMCGAPVEISKRTHTDVTGQLLGWLLSIDDALNDSPFWSVDANMKAAHAELRFYRCSANPDLLPCQIV